MAALTKLHWKRTRGEWLARSYYKPTEMPGRAIEWRVYKLTMRDWAIGLSLFDKGKPTGKHLVVGVEQTCSAAKETAFSTAIRLGHSVVDPA